MERNCHKFESRPAVHVFGSCAEYVSRGLPNSLRLLNIQLLPQKHTHRHVPCFFFFFVSKAGGRSSQKWRLRLSSAQLLLAVDLSFSDYWFFISALSAAHPRVNQAEEPKTSTPRAGAGGGTVGGGMGVWIRGLVSCELGARPRGIRTCLGRHGKKMYNIDEQSDTRLKKNKERIQ